MSMTCTYLTLRCMLLSSPLQKERRSIQTSERHALKNHFQLTTGLPFFSSESMYARLYATLIAYLAVTIKFIQIVLAQWLRSLSCERNNCMSRFYSVKAVMYILNTLYRENVSHARNLLLGRESFMSLKI